MWVFIYFLGFSAKLLAEVSMEEEEAEIEEIAVAWLLEPIEILCPECTEPIGRGQFFIVARAAGRACILIEYVHCSQCGKRLAIPETYENSVAVARRYVEIQTAFEAGETVPLNLADREILTRGL